MLSSGGRSATLCDMAVLYKRILLSNASAFCVVHNHPSGNNAPSQMDIELTKKIYQASLILDLKLLDHVIIAGDDYYSFCDNGHL